MSGLTGNCPRVKGEKSFQPEMFDFQGLKRMDMI